MGAHLVDVDVVQVGGKARLRLEACGSKSRCGQTGCAGAEGTREIFERQLGGCFGARLSQGGGEAVTMCDAEGQGRDQCLWRGCLAGRNRGAGQNKIDIVYAIRSGDDNGTQSGPWPVCCS